jgi:hypothetical protein
MLKMDEQKLNAMLVFLFTVLLVTLAGLFFSLTVSKTGRAGDMQTSPSKVKIKGYVAIARSDNLTDGIDFGEVESLPAFLNGTANYNGSDQTEYYISVAQQSNKAADFCLNATPLDTDAGDYIGLGNYTLANSSSNDANNPSLNIRIPMPSTPTKVSYNIGKGDDSYYRFWLNISDQQAPGLYNNSVSFIAVPTGDSCT